MTPLLIGLGAIAALLILIVLGLEIAFSLALVGVAGLFLLGGLPLAQGVLSTVPYSSVASFTLVILPMFILMGELAVAAGMAQNAYVAARAWLGRLPGGFMMAAIGASTVFAAASGSSMAATVTIGRVSIAEMRRYGYDGGLAAGTVAVSGTLAALIPPSALLVFYALLSDQSISAMLLAGIGPGLLSAAFFIATAYLLGKLFPALAPRVAQRTDWRERLNSLRLIAPFGGLVLIVLGGIYSGLVTATEASAFGAAAALVLLGLSGRLSQPVLRGALSSSARISCMIFAIIIGGMLFSRFLAFSGVPLALAGLIHGLDVPPITIVLVMILILTVLGLFVDPVSMLMLTLPFFLPIVRELGIDLVWFGVLVALQAELGVITPPIGIHLFMVQKIAPDIPLGSIIRGCLPYMGCQFLIVGLILAFPEIALFLPGLMH